MEYYGKILCISYKDLTYDDRPVIREDGKADYSKSRALRGHHPSMLSMEELAPIMSVVHDAGRHIGCVVSGATRYYYR